MSESEAGEFQGLNFKIPTQEEISKIRQDWEKYWNERKGEMLEKEALEKLLSENSDPGNTSDNKTIPGSCQVDSPQVLYTIYSLYFGDENARREVAHEVEHAQVYESHGIPYHYGIALGKVGENGIYGVALVNPEFPTDMGIEERRAIINEANIAVTHPSSRDIAAIKKHETSS